MNDVISAVGRPFRTDPALRAKGPKGRHTAVSLLRWNAVQQGVQDGHHDHRQHRADDQPEEDRHGQRHPEHVLQHGQHAEHGGAGGVDHRAQARHGRLDDRVVGDDAPWQDSIFTSSSSTTTFLIIMPDRLMAPSSAMKPNGVCVISSPAVMPIITKGMTRMQISMGRKPLNRATRMNSMITTAGTMPGVSAPATAWRSSTRRPNPAGSRAEVSIASNLSSTALRSVGAVTPLGEHCTVIARRRSHRQMIGSSHGRSIPSTTCETGTAWVESSRRDLEFLQRGGGALPFRLDAAGHDRDQIVLLPILADDDAVGGPLRRAGQIVARHAGPAAPLLVVAGNQGRNALAPVGADFLGVGAVAQNVRAFFRQAAQRVPDRHWPGR